MTGAESALLPVATVAKKSTTTTTITTTATTVTPLRATQPRVVTLDQLSAAGLTIDLSSMLPAAVSVDHALGTNAAASASRGVSMFGKQPSRIVISASATTAAAAKPQPAAAVTKDSLLDRQISNFSIFSLFDFDENMDALAAPATGTCAGAVASTVYSLMRSHSEMSDDFLTMLSALREEGQCASPQLGVGAGKGTDSRMVLTRKISSDAA